MADVSASPANKAALMETPIIRFNLRELGRKHTGKKRNFDIGGCVRYVNSPECQERMKNRELIGYYGHIARQAFDKLAPHEGGVVNGKWCTPEPAIVTTHLQASPDGTIEHKAQFLDTDAGKLAAKLYQSRVGGFSGVWKDRFGTAFMGFDYVLEPNYSTNRGYIMDSLNAESLALEMENETIRGALAVFDSLTAERDRALEARDRAGGVITDHR